MGAKDWILTYADRDIPETLRAAPPMDRAAARAMVERLHPGRRPVPLADGMLSDHANPPADIVYATCLPGVLPYWLAWYVAGALALGAAVLSLLLFRTRRHDRVTPPADGLAQPGRWALKTT